MARAPTTSDGARLSPDGTGHEHGDLERRVTRLETWMDARLVTRDVFEVHMTGINNRLANVEEADTWLMRFIVMALIGVVVNAVFTAIIVLGR